MTKIAVDVQVSRESVVKLRAAGFDVVVRAMEGERDDEWLALAKLEGAEMIVSPDSDCEIWAYDQNIPFAKIPGSGPFDVVALVRRAWRNR